MSFCDYSCILCGHLVCSAHSKPSTAWLREYRAGESSSARSFFVTLAVPARLSQIGITTISLGALDYITGIRLLADEESNARAGYQSHSDEILCPLHGLRGFRLAVGPGGVRALQAIDRDGCSLPWIGRMKGLPVSERLIGLEPLKSLRVTTDGFKITALAIPSKQTTLLKAPNPAMSWRQAGLWYPHVPPKDLWLNEGSFTGQDPLRRAIDRVRCELWAQRYEERSRRDSDFEHRDLYKSEPWFERLRITIYRNIPGTYAWRLSQSLSTDLSSVHYFKRPCQDCESLNSHDNTSSLTFLSFPSCSVTAEDRKEDGLL